jgi:hypothetical protein
MDVIPSHLTKRTPLPQITLHLHLGTAGGALTRNFLIKIVCAFLFLLLKIQVQCIITFPSSFSTDTKQLDYEILYSQGGEY